MTRVSDVVYETPGARPDVPVRLIADDELLAQVHKDRSLEQLRNVSTLPGVARFVVGMPDMHEGYGFPVGGVAATRPPRGAISPGGIGFDINCGVRLLASSLRRGSIEPLPLVHELSRSVPTGYGRTGRIALSPKELDAVLRDGCAYLIGEKGMGRPEDLETIESQGSLPGADPSKVSERAKHRGRDQLGTLGGGNHFLEVDVVDAVFDETAARALGLFPEQITVLIHSGSRGLGHQVCTDYVRRMDGELSLYGFELPDRQLSCAPFDSPAGSDYFAAMCAAANFAWCNRQALTEHVRTVFARLFPRSSSEISLVYDVAHNIAKLERCGGEELLVHRKGATRAFWPGHPELPERYREVGQPIFIPGSMGTCSFVLVGTKASESVSLSSTCHGAGRALSRGAAKRTVSGAELRKQLESQGIVVRCPSNAELAEEAPLAYKDVEHVIDVVERAGIARKVARLKPIGVLKG
ncbi:MAG: RtcB family protein [Pseudomonadota bacterium]